MDYHAHVYWKDEAEKSLALSYRDTLKEFGCGLGYIWNMPIGPHPLPMYQVMYNSSNKELVELYLKTKSLSILLHEDIGVDHVRDHTDGARWINEPLELNLKFLEDVQ
jgi:DOPA 4,5-dioxygenase